tara:strand:+ start:812 stop:1486 length:675 start_codon:yes stop_codon:yes gene_type:complete
MGGDYVDVIIFAAIAAFLVFRLVSVLGKRTGQEGSRDPFGIARSADITEREKNPEKSRVASGLDPQDDNVNMSTPLKSGLERIMAADSGFNEADFQTGAQSAFEMVITAFALGDTGTLKSLLSESVYANFDHAITQRKRAGETQETSLVGIDSVEVIEACLLNSTAQVTVKFVSKQVSVCRDQSGAVIDGDPEAVNQVTDIWTFARDTRGKDPNWLLVETRSSN